MKLLEARAKLKELSGGKYRNLAYSLTEHRDREVGISCTVYVDGQEHHTGETWEEALQEMEYAIFPDRKPVPEVEDV